MRVSGAGGENGAEKSAAGFAGSQIAAPPGRYSRETLKGYVWIIVPACWEIIRLVSTFKIELIQQSVSYIKYHKAIKWQC